MNFSKASGPSRRRKSMKFLEWKKKKTSLGANLLRMVLVLLLTPLAATAESGAAVRLLESAIVGLVTSLQYLHRT